MDNLGNAIAGLASHGRTAKGKHVKCFQAFHAQLRCAELLKHGWRQNGSLGLPMLDDVSEIVDRQGFFVGQDKWCCRYNWEHHVEYPHKMEEWADGKDPLASLCNCNHATNPIFGGGQLANLLQGDEIAICHRDRLGHT